MAKKGVASVIFGHKGHTLRSQHSAIVSCLLLALYESTQPKHEEPTPDCHTFQSSGDSTKPWWSSLPLRRRESEAWRSGEQVFLWEVWVLDSAWVPELVLLKFSVFWVWAESAVLQHTEPPGPQTWTREWFLSNDTHSHKVSWTGPLCVFPRILFSAFGDSQIKLKWTTICNSSLIVKGMVWDSGHSGEHPMPSDMCIGCTLVGKLSKTWGWSMGSEVCLLQLSGVWFIKATVNQRRKEEEKTLVVFPIRLTCPEEGTLELRHTLLWVSPVHLFIFVPLLYVLVIDDRTTHSLRGHSLSMLKFRSG